MYYSSGNYEAFAPAVKPEGIDNKRAWIGGVLPGPRRPDAGRSYYAL